MRIELSQLNMRTARRWTAVKKGLYWEYTSGPFFLYRSKGDRVWRLSYSTKKTIVGAAVGSYEELNYGLRTLPGRAR